MRGVLRSWRIRFYLIIGAAPTAGIRLRLGQAFFFCQRGGWDSVFLFGPHGAGACGAVSLTPAVPDASRPGRLRGGAACRGAPCALGALRRFHTAQALVYGGCGALRASLWAGSPSGAGVSRAWTRMTEAGDLGCGVRPLNRGLTP